MGEWNASVSASMGTTWLPIDGWPYQVSSDGRVRRAESGKIVQGVDNGKGYAVLNLCKDSKPKTFLVSRLVCAAFHGPAPEGKPHCAHRDCDSWNNKASNLRWATPQENINDTVSCGRNSKGARHAHAKFTEDDVLDMRLLWAMGMYPREIAAAFNTNPSRAWRIATREQWRHI